MNRRTFFKLSLLPSFALLKSCATHRVEARVDRRSNVADRVDHNIRTRRAARDERMRRARQRNMGRY